MSAAQIAVVGCAASFLDPLKSLLKLISQHCFFLSSGVQSEEYRDVVILEYHTGFASFIVT